jgi:hypothetical protein
MYLIKQLSFLLLIFISTNKLIAQFNHPMIFEINSPTSIDSSYNYGPQSSTGWGITSLPQKKVSGQLVWGYDITPDTLLCDPVTNDYTGKIVMVRRGVCNFSQKIYNAQLAGAVGCIICNNNGGTDVITMTGGTNGPLVTIPSVMLSSQNCASIAAALAAGDTVIATFKAALGSVSYDWDQDCTRDSIDYSLSGRNILIQPGNITVQSDATGNWDLEGLISGSYTATIDTSNNWNSCSITRNFTIVHPDSILVVPDFGLYPQFISTTNSTNANCTSANGSATVTLQNGVSPFIYSWNNGQTTSTAINLTPGIYYVTVTDATMSSITDSITVSQTNTTVYANLGLVANSICGGSTGISISYTYGGTNPYTYIWNNGATNDIIYNLSVGDYTVTATDAYGCFGIDTITIGIEPISISSEICLVSVDSADGKNLIVWEKPINQGVAYFKINKQNTITSQFDSIGISPIDSFSIFKDINSSPSQQSASYKITPVDSCGSEGSGTVHTTIHLSANQGVNNNVNLQWNAYSGFSYSNFELYRSNNGLAYSLIGTVANSSFSYTDLTPPLGTNYYYVSVTKPTPCNPTKAAPVLKSISNILDGNGNPVNVTPQQFEKFTVYPNPADDYVIVSQFGNISGIKIIITDMLGKIISTENLEANDKFFISTPNLAGLYNLMIINENGNTSSKIIVRK